MTSLLQDEMDCDWENRKAIFWLLLLLYRRPKLFKKRLNEYVKSFTRRKTIFLGIRIVIRSLPFFIIFVLLIRFFLFNVIGILPLTLINTVNEHLFFHIFGALLGITVGITVGVIFGFTIGFTVGIAFGISTGIAFGIVGGIAQGNIIGFFFGIAIGIASSIAFSIMDGLTFGTIIGLTFGVIIGFMDGIPNGLTFLANFGITFIISILRLYYLPCHLSFITVPRYPRLKIHPIYWDDLCAVPFPRLERILVSHAELKHEEGNSEIERIIDTCPSQRHSAFKAKTILLARQSARITQICDIEKSVNQLPEGHRGFLKQVPAIKRMVHRICQLQNRIETMTRPFLKAPLVSDLFTKIENFRHVVAKYREPLASEFCKAADNWLKIAQNHMEQTQAIQQKEPTQQIFRAGDPVNKDQEAFIPRNRVIEDLERQAMLNTGCPGIVLYGRRRMGKTTILNNLSGFIPEMVNSVFISMQSAQAFSSLESLIRLIYQKLGFALVKAKLPTRAPASLKKLSEFLTRANTYLGSINHRILICLDEYETIELKIFNRTFSEDLLATIRESMQTHRQITWVFAGSHEITELTHAPWTSYLISARTIEVPLFTPSETRLLLTEPMKYSSRWDRNEQKRPRFAPDFWGENGIERLHEQAGGWPHLVQLIAETIVDLVNDSAKFSADNAIFEQALDQSIVKGHNVLYELVHRECTLPGEWEYLSAFRRKPAQPLPDNDEIYRSLKRRLLVVEENGEFRLRVPLMERWLKERG